LTQGKYALIDEADFDLVSQHKWQAKPHRRTVYAAAGLYENGRHRVIRMHRLILQAGDGQSVDHINGDGLDNRRANLRFATPSQNQHNRRGSAKASSSYKGVFWHKGSRKWLAQITVNWKAIYLGLYADEMEAALAYDCAARELHGEFARLNFPDLEGE
jgi:hypothetical protein